MPNAECFPPTSKPSLLKCPVLRNLLLLALVGLSCELLGGAQQPPAPKVKVNVLNVCSPSPEEQKEISSALARIPRQPLFSDDFEVDRGQSILDEPAGFLQPQPGGAAPSDSDSDRSVAAWVRIRREFSVQALFSTVQYSFSRDAKNMVETLMFRVREPKDLLQVTIEDSASTVTTAPAMLSTDTPATRIKLERFGKPSVVLARCSSAEGGTVPNQTAYEPLFQSASGVVANYRRLLAVEHTVPDELERVTGTARRESKPAARKAKRK